MSTDPVVVRLASDQYKFGVGPLELRIQAVLCKQQLGDTDWLYVRGVQVHWNGFEEQRQVLVRMSAFSGQHLRALAEMSAIGQVNYHATDALPGEPGPH